MAKMLFTCSHGKDEPERATLPFIAANVAATAGQEAIVVLTIEGSWLCKQGYADGIAAEGLPELKPLIDEFVENGGVVWGCAACTKPRGITEDDLIDGAAIVGAAKVVEEVAAGASSIDFG